METGAQENCMSSSANRSRRRTVIWYERGSNSYSRWYDHQPFGNHLHFILSLLKFENDRLVL